MMFLLRCKPCASLHSCNLQALSCEHTSRLSAHYRRRLFTMSSPKKGYETCPLVMQMYPCEEQSKVL